MISFNNENITYDGYDGSVEAKLSVHLGEVSQGMLAIPSGPLVDADVHVYIWKYVYYIESVQFEKLCTLPAETLELFRGRDMVYENAVVWPRAILSAHFRYMDQE